MNVLLMSPWEVLGWILVIIIGGYFALSLLVFLGALAKVIIDDFLEHHKRKRANKGKVRCEEKGCKNVATRRGASGFICEDHLSPRFVKRGNLSYAFLLDHEKERRENNEVL